MSKKEEEKFVICDFDGTLIVKPNYNCTSGDFLHDDFIKACELSAPIPSTVWNIQDLAAKGFRIFFVTSRPVKYREVTNRRIQSLINREGEKPVEYNLLMTPDSFDEQMCKVAKQMFDDGNDEDGTQYVRKTQASFRELVRESLIDTLKVKDLSGFVTFDDHEENLKIWKEKGAECWLVLPNCDHVFYEGENEGEE